MYTKTYSTIGPAWYISRRPNSWLCFRVQKLGILDTQIQMGVSQRVFIPSRASKCMLESKHESFRKWKKIWSWATSFWSFGNFRKYAIYIFYIYALRGYSGWWSCPTSKKIFLRIHYCICFTSGIVVGSWNQPENDIFDHFYARKSHFLSFLTKFAQKMWRFERST